MKLSNILSLYKFIVVVLRGVRWEYITSLKWSLGPQTQDLMDLENHEVDAIYHAVSNPEIVIQFQQQEALRSLGKL